ncbi:hypothetical protein C4577_07950 [Candidatus Parcubacteria bacterium]|nr:MAG: hypothetical protein C4577_07950 [Candidatus Parcubacteria bacterium]
MVATAHLVAGAFLGRKLKKSKYIVPVSFASHFVLDSIPHWQPVVNLQDWNSTTFVGVFGDVFLALFLLFLILKKNSKFFYPILLGFFFAVLPDFGLGFSLYLPFILEIPPISYFWDFHIYVHRHTSSLLGIIPQLFIIFFGLFFLLKKKID